LAVAWTPPPSLESSARGQAPSRKGELSILSLVLRGAEPSCLGAEPGGGLALVKCAAALDRAYREAMRDDPVALSAAYRGWCKEFGLTPQAQRLLPVLPLAAGTPLRVVGG